MRHFLLKSPAAVVCLLAIGGPLSTADVLAPPFGLQWGDNPGRLIDWAAQMQLDQLVKTRARDPGLKIFLFTSQTGKLPGHEASELEARFYDGRLFEIALRYRYPGKKADFVRGKFAELRGILTRRHGPFKPSGRDEDVTRDGITIRSQAYRIDPARNRWLLLAQTEVMDRVRGDAAVKFSVVYHNDDVLRGGGDRIEIRPEGADYPEAVIDSAVPELPIDENGLPQ